MTISEHYHKLKPEHVDAFADELAEAWQNPSLPEAQYEAVVKKELADYRLGIPSRPYDALANLLSQIPLLSSDETTLLDVGASSGYYREVLSILRFRCAYTALDYSPYYKDFAERLFPGIDFKIGSATDLPFESKSFDLVLHGAVLMHLKHYEDAILEAARVAKQYVIFHRTPVYTDNTPTEAFVKTAYGVPTCEWHYNENEMLGLFERHRLSLQASADVFMDGNFGHRS